MAIELPIHLRETSTDGSVSQSSLDAAMTMLGGVGQLRHILLSHSKECQVYENQKRDPKTKKLITTTSSSSTTSTTTSSTTTAAAMALNRCETPATSFVDDTSLTLDFHYTPNNPFALPVVATRLPNPTVPETSMKVYEAQKMDGYIYDIQTKKIVRKIRMMYRFNGLAPYELVQNGQQQQQQHLPSWNDKIEKMNNASLPTAESSSSSSSSSSSTTTTTFCASAVPLIGPLPIKVSDWANMPRAYLKNLSELATSELLQKKMGRQGGRVSHGVNVATHTKQRIERTKECNKAFDLCTPLPVGVSDSTKEFIKNHKAPTRNKKKMKETKNCLAKLFQERCVLKKKKKKKLF